MVRLDDILDKKKYVDEHDLKRYLGVLDLVTIATVFHTDVTLGRDPTTALARRLINF